MDTPLTLDATASALDGPGPNRLQYDPLFILIALATLAATALIWWPAQAPNTGLGMSIGLSGIVLAVGALAGFSRILSRRALREMQNRLNREQSISDRLEPSITEEQSGLRMRYISAWLVAGLGLVASIVLWQTPNVERLIGSSGIIAVGLLTSGVLGLAVAANVVNRAKTKRLSRDLRTALQSERLALATLGALEVMYSACLPTGERSRFSDSFLRLLGCSDFDAQGRGWLELVHPDDRDSILELLARPLSRRQIREHNFCIRDRNGGFVWLHEKLSPRFDTDGNLIEYICTAFNITRFVENETAMDKQINELSTQVATTSAKLADARDELSKAKASRNRFKTNLDEARDEVKVLQAALDKAESRLETAKADAADRLRESKAEAKASIADAEKRLAAADRAAETRIEKIKEEANERIAAAEDAAEERLAKLDEALKTARREAQQATSENKKLSAAFEKMHEELGRSRQESGELREQLARQIKETRQAREEADSAAEREARHRVKSERLTQRSTELESKLKHLEAELAEAKDEAGNAAASAAEEVERRLHEVSAEALAGHLQKHLDGAARMTGDLLSQASDGPLLDSARNAAASIRAMSELVEQAASSNNGKKRKGKAARASRSKASASFELRRTVQGVAELLEDDAKSRGVKLAVEIESNVPSLVQGDDVELRAALLALTQAALASVEDGTLTLRLGEDLRTRSHSTLRCELHHGSARIKPDDLVAALALESTDKQMPDASRRPLAHAAAKAWQTLRGLEGQHGFMLPDTGGLSVWFTFTLARPASSKWHGAGSSTDDEVIAPAPMRAAPAHPQPESAAHATIATLAPVEPEIEAPPATTDVREMPRMAQEMLYSNLGEVTALGGDSVRLLCTRKLRAGEVEISFEGSDLALRAEVAWSKKLSGRKHDVGLKFLNVTPELRRRLVRLAVQHRRIETLGGG